MKKIVIVLIAICFVACQTENKYYYDDPFSVQLDTYYNNMETQKKIFAYEALIFALSLVGSSIAVNMRSADIGNRNWNNAGMITGYAFATVSFGLGIYAFDQWSESSSMYYETLRLQTQYYNTLQK
jgi:hypothetical protein